MSAALDAIEAIRQRVDLAELVGEHVDLRRARNGRLVGRCPFHAETTRSFTVGDDHAYCFGCQWRGDVFAFVMQISGISFTAAVAELAHRAGVSLDGRGRVVVMRKTGGACRARFPRKRPGMVIPFVRRDQPE